MKQLLARVHAIGAEVIAPAAADVDAHARFPTEAFDALKAEGLMSSYVPTELGGMGHDVQQTAAICEALALYCGSTAMVFAMHQIQVACIVHHALDSAWFRDFVGELVRDQLLLASATTEIHIGGNLRTSGCAVERDGDRFSLHKVAPVISYGEASDAILVTARRAEDSAPSDQVHVLVRKRDTTLSPISGWDTLGFRGTCSQGFDLNATGDVQQVLPVPYAEIHERTMHPFSHSVWAALWVGIATDAFKRAQGFVRARARKTPGTMPPSAMRLAEVDTVLYTMRGSVRDAVQGYQELLDQDDPTAFQSNFAFSTRMNNLKVTASQLMVDVVGGCMIICGIAGYRNDGKHSLARQLRDAYGAQVMVNNDRILGQSAPILLVRRGF